MDFHDSLDHGINDPRQAVAVIHRRWKAVALAFGVTLVAALVTTFTAKPVYRATATLVIEKADPVSLVYQWNYSSYDPEFYVTQQKLISSRPVARKAAELISRDKELRAGLGLPAEPAEEDINGIAASLAGGIDVEPVPESRLVSLHYDSWSPKLAAALANAFADAYISATADMRIIGSGDTLRWMTEKVREERERLQASEEALQAYMRDNEIFVIEDKLSVAPENLAELSSMATKAEARKQELDTLIEQIRALPPDLAGADTIPQVAGDPTVRAVSERMIEAEARLTEMSRRFGEKHREIKAVKDEIEALRSQKRAEQRRVIDTIGKEYEMAVENRAKLGELLRSGRKDAINLSGKYVQYGVLKREVDTNRQIYDTLFTKMKEQNITGDVQRVNVWVVERAELPAAPISPNKKRNVFGGVAMGLIFGIALAFFIEYLDMTVMHPGDVERKLHLPVLGAVPFIKPDMDRAIELIVAREPMSVEAESYKALRTSVMLSSAKAAPKRVLVTSALAGEGKTATALNLAMAVAQMHRKVLVIDADFRRARIHSILGLDNVSGLSNHLAGEAPEPHIYSNVAGGLDVITSGTTPPNPTELLGSDNFRAFLERMAERYDMVICDSPPMLSITDSLLMSRLFDGVVLVTRAGRTRYDAVLRCAKQLGDINAKFLGVVVNALKFSKADTYYGSYGYYSQGRTE